MSFDLYLHASEDQTRKIPRAELDTAMALLEGVKSVSKRDYVLEAPEGFRIELEVETETAAGGDVKGIYVHAASGSGPAAYERAKELALQLVAKLSLHIYDHQRGSYVSRDAFSAAAIPEDGVVFRAASGRPPAPASVPVPMSGSGSEASRPAASGGLAAAHKGGGCAGLLMACALGLAAMAAAVL